MNTSRKRSCSYIKLCRQYRNLTTILIHEDIKSRIDEGILQSNCCSYSVSEVWVLTKRLYTYSGCRDGISLYIKEMVRGIIMISGRN